MVNDRVGQIGKVFIHPKEIVDGRVDRFSDVLQVKRQRKGSMVESLVLAGCFMCPKENIEHQQILDK